ncbi:hypothetical protein BGZ54_005646 [Gamsiella multidivaricata]|nr:hypothetical protein BGZ54_005646 [Gamsiella multidivaricata]
MSWSVDCSGATASVPAPHHLHTAQHTQHTSISQPVPEKFPVCDRHLREFCASHGPSSGLPDFNGLETTTNTTVTDESHQPLKERVSIKPMEFVNYLLDGLALYIRNLREPSTIPGRGFWSKLYAIGLLPALIGVLVFCQWTITFVILWSSYTTLGRKAFQLFLKDQILMFDTTVDPHGTDEALKQLTDMQPKSKPSFSYYLANLMLILSTVTYERDDNLVKSASLIMSDMESEAQRAEAAALLQASEQTIDAKAQLLGMRFMGVSELKSLGGPYAGLFYNDESILLVYKGTSVLAFNEYLIDGMIQRVDAREYLYGEVHKGFYESLFPDPAPLDCYERATYDRTNPFNTIMQTIFETAKKLKQKTGKPVNLWMTGHSLGGALAALTIARLQMPLRDEDPLFKHCDPAAVRTHNSDGSPRTVIQEMLYRFNATSSSIASSSSVSTLSSSSTATESTFPFSFFHLGHRHHGNEHEHGHHYKHTHNDDDLIILRDCYSFASPKLGDSEFAQRFDQHHTQFLNNATHKPVYYRVIVDKDIVPRMPPSCSTDPDDHHERMFPCLKCSKTKATVEESHESATAPLRSQRNQSASYGSVDSSSNTKQSSTAAPQHLNSLLDYRHVGQMVSLPNKPLPPTVKPSDFQTNLCAGVLRTDDNMKELLQQIEITLTEASTDSARATSGSYFSFWKKSSSQSTKSRFDSQKMAQEIDRAKLKYDLNEQSRLRVPCDAEKFLLTFPNVISHSPATYQRNLVRSRYFFTSFPGTETETLIRETVQKKASDAKDSVVVAITEIVQVERVQQEEETSKLERPKLGVWVNRDSGVSVTMSI